MNKMRFIFTFFCFILVSFCYADAKVNANSPLGYWKTIDDVTNQPKAVVQLWQADNKLFGRIVKIFPGAGRDEHEVCEKCEGAKHNQPIVGMVFLENLEHSKDDMKQWENGSILDPKNGKVYHSQIRLTDNGQKLSVRGYLGVPLFGRSQTWLRVPDDIHS